jgi:O-succinylbenzoic acid--CoA ligase
VTDLLARRAAVTPGRTALADAAGGPRTFAELDAGVELTARRLAALVDPDDHVGVLMSPRPAFVRLLFAADRLGATAVPLNVRLAVPELEAQVAAADLDALVCDAGQRRAARDAAGDRPVACVDGPGDAVQAFDAESPFEAAERPLDARRLILFTSGTTGDPKPVEVTGRNLLSSAVASAFRLGVSPDDRWYDPLALYHTGGIAPVVRSALYGTAVVIDSRGFDAEAAADALTDATCVSLVPTMLRRLLDAGATDALAGVRFVLLGGAPARPDLIETCAAHDIPVCPTYGMTETASQVATARPAEAYDDPGTVGAPLLSAELTVVGDDGPVPEGETGEIVVRGPTVTPGYYGRPVATSEAFGPHGLYTGDVGRVEDGRLSVLNRRSDRIVTGGENVDPGAVAAAVREHPDVADAAVVGVPDEEWGEAVAALVVPDGDPPDSDAVQSFLRDRIAGFEVPRRVAFAESLPRTASGTVDREAVRGQF